MVAMSIMAILFLGTMNLYTEAIRASTKSDAQITSSQSAATGLQHVEDDVREAYDFALPEDSATFGSTLGAGYGPSSFQATYIDPVTSLSKTIDTGIMLTYPAATTATVYDSSGAPISPAVPLYDKTAPGSVLYIYRADMPATSGGATPAIPDPLLGDCLWASGSENGTAINRSLTRLSDSRRAAGGITSSNTVPDAIELLRPSNASYQVEIRLISSYYSPISNMNSTLANQQSSEGDKTLLAGKCVLMRDHKNGS